MILLTLGAQNMAQLMTPRPDPARPQSNGVVAFVKPTTPRNGTVKTG
ncbi:hypothetical protein [Asticcacaulis tiandongensis]|nr:hypothetical protein [Asticcacaulis tiandongensis]